jgi:membrane protein
MFKVVTDTGRAFGYLIMRVPALAITVRAIGRVMQREVMLYAGGASFFALLALFPAIAVFASIYGLIYTSTEALNQVTQLTEVLPPAVGRFILVQLSQLTGTSSTVLTVQGLVALFVALFAASRGTKALITGLNQIAGKGDLRSMVKFNLIAVAAVLGGAALVATANLIVFAVPTIIRPAAAFLGFEDINLGFIANEWTVSILAMGAALLLLYRYVMQRAQETSWFASLVAAAAASALWLGLSKAFTAYVAAFVNATAYGSLGAVIVFLLWIYWAAYALFFGGALAVEIDNHRRRKPLPGPRPGEE